MQNSTIKPKKESGQLGTCVVVLGMHRSGTSAVAGSLSRLGIFFGDNLLPAAPYNPKGFYEHMDILNTDEEILRTLNTTFQDIAPLPHDWHKSISILPLKERLIEIIERDFSGKPVFGFKDPRISILLPLYLDIFREMNLDVRFVVCERPTVEIARSLEERIGYTLHQSLLLCKKYQAAIEESLRNAHDARGQQYAYTRVQMSDFVNGPESEISRIISELDLPIRPTEEASRDIKDFIEVGLKHHTLTTEGVLFETAEALDKKSADLSESLADVGRLAASLEEKALAIEQLENRAKVLEEDVAAFRDQNASLQKDLAIALDYKKNLESNNEALQREVHEHEEDKKSLELHFLQLQKGYDEHVEHASHLESQARRLHNTLAHRDHRIRFLEQEALKFLDIDPTEQNKIQAEIVSLRDSIDAIQRSLSWKIVHPIQKTLDRIIPPRSIIRRPYIKILKILQDRTQGSKNKKGEDSAGAHLSGSMMDSPLSVVEPDILFINHEESRTGAPRIVFEIAKGALEKYSIAVISKIKGGMSGEFQKTFGSNLLYPHDLLEQRERHEMARIMLEKIRPKLVYVNSIVSYEYACEAKKLGIPVIMHIHEMANAYDVAISAESHADFASFADVFIVVSEATKRDLMSIMRVPENRVRLIHEFVDSKNILNLSQHQPLGVVEEMLGIDSDDLLIVSMGTFDKRKGGDYFIKLAKRFAQLNSQNKQKIKMLWIGRRPRQHDLFAMMFQENRDAFLHIDEIQNPFPFLARADIFFMSSREDPFPLVVLEAMALQKPVVAFEKAGGAAEAGGDSISLIHSFNVDEAYKVLYRLAADAEDRKRRGSIGQGRQKLYESEVILSKIYAEIDMLL